MAGWPPSLPPWTPRRPSAPWPGAGARAIAALRGRSPLGRTHRRLAAAGLPGTAAMALRMVKGSIDRMFDKNLQDLVRGIRNHKEDEVRAPWGWAVPVSDAWSQAC